MPDEPTQTTPEQVQAFLQNRAVPPTAPPEERAPQINPVNIPLELDPAAEAFVQSTATQKSATPDTPGAVPAAPVEELPTRLETDPSPLSDPEMPTMSHKVFWAARDAHVGDVVVSDDEKAIYLKAALNDATLIWDIAMLQGQLKVKCRSLNHYELDVIFRAVRMDEEENVIAFEEQRFSRIQWYTACLQVMAIQDKGTTFLSFTPSKEADVNEDARKLREHYDETYQHTSPPRWSQMLTGLRIFSIKEKLCNDALANEDFWKPAVGD